MKWSTRIFWVLSALGALYGIFMGCLLDPRIQRFVLYANKINTLFMDDLYKPQDFGFMKGQVRPFNVTTPDGETLFAWHVLPLEIYAEHEAELVAEYELGAVPYLQSLAFKLAHEDIDSKVVVSFHGNAGHLANGYRKATYRALSIASGAHVIAFDYRGFGLSTGSPTEEGLITDGIAVVNFVLNELLVPSERIVLLAQSLGTAIATATALHFSDPNAASKLLPERPVELVHPTARPAGDFAGVILIAPFLSIPTLMKTYRILGIVPILSPLRFYPTVENYFIDRITETLDTKERVSALVRASAARTSPTRYLYLHLLHATNDFDIPWRHSQDLFYAAAGASQFPDGVTRDVFASWQQTESSEGRGRRLRWAWGKEASIQGTKTGNGEALVEVLQAGGHNEITGFVNVPLAVERAFARLERVAET